MLTNFRAVRELIDNYLKLQVEIKGSKWDGPDPDDWKLDPDGSDEDGVQLFWTGWEGCHCHGHKTTDSKYIRMEYLLANPDDLRAAYKEVVAKEARMAEEAKAEAKKRQEAEELKRLAELAAKYPNFGGHQ